MPTFGLITEGPSDQAVIENILIGFFNLDISDDIKPLQPNKDATDDSSTMHGGWSRVISYCMSDFFSDAFISLDYLVIQIDTDRCGELNYEVNVFDEKGKKIDSILIVERVRDKFISNFRSSFGDEFYEKFKERIIFAISVETIECWLLPIYYSDKRKSDTINCSKKLFDKIRKDDIKLRSSSNVYNQYDELSKEYRKSKVYNINKKLNPSLEIFTTELESKVKLP
jgi:hypothetical protein